MLRAEKTIPPTTPGAARERPAAEGAAPARLRSQGPGDLVSDSPRQSVQRQQLERAFGAVLNPGSIDRGEVVQRKLTILQGEVPKPLPQKVGLQLPKSGILKANKDQLAAIDRLGIPSESLPALYKLLDEWAKDDTDREPMTWEAAMRAAWEQSKPPPPPPSKLDESTKLKYDRAADSRENTMMSGEHASNVSTEELQLPPTLERFPPQMWPLILRWVFEARVVEGRLIVTRPHDVVRLMTVSKAMRRLIQRVLQFDPTAVGQRVTRTVDDLSFKNSMPAIRQIGLHLLRAYPPDRFVYLVPGGSLLPVAVLMQQLCPALTFVPLPISGLSEDALRKDKRSFDLQRFGPFYHHYLRHFMPSDPKALPLPYCSLLLMDFSDSGSTIRILRGQITAYMESLGIVNAAKYLHTFELNTNSPEALTRLTSSPSTSSTSSALHPPNYDDIRRFYVALKGERLKDLELVLYKKREGTGSNFQGELADRQRQTVSVERFMTLWFAIQRALREMK